MYLDIIVCLHPITQDRHSISHPWEWCMGLFLRSKSWTHWLYREWLSSKSQNDIHFSLDMITITQAYLNFAMLWQLSCRGLVIIVAWSDHNFPRQNTPIFWLKLLGLLAHKRVMIWVSNQGSTFVNTVLYATAPVTLSQPKHPRSSRLNLSGERTGKLTTFCRQFPSFWRAAVDLKPSEYPTHTALLTIFPNHTRSI